MSLDRKTFLRRLGLGALGLAAGPRLPAAMAKTPRVGGDAWEEVREHYLFEPGFTYFNTGGIGPMRREVVETVEATMRRFQAHSETGHFVFEETRPILAKFLGVDPEEIAFMRNATEGNSVVATGLRLQAGDEVILETHAHPGGSLTWLNQAKLNGAVVKFFVPDPDSVDGNLKRIQELMTPRTRVVQVSHVTAPTGILLPVVEIARMCREAGVWFHIDGAQTLGMFPFSLREIGCDSYASSGHKWLGGPHGTGVFYLRRDRLDEVAPMFIGAYSGWVPRLPGELTYSPGAVRFEYGTRDAAAIAGLRLAMQLQESMGRERIAHHGRNLAEYLGRELRALPDVEVLTPVAPELRVSIVTFRSPRLGFEAMFGQLLEEHRMRCRPVSEQGLDAVRVSTHVFNTKAECDALVDAIAQVLRKA